MSQSKPVTQAEIAVAVAALQLNTPIRSAERKGASIILHTRSGDFTYTPRSRARARKRKPQESE